MKKFLLATLAAFCVTAQADDIIVYKNNFTVTTTGSGALSKTKLTGWTIVDGETADVSIVAVDVPRKRYSIHTPSFEIESVSAPLGKSYTVFIIRGGQFDGMTIKGLNRSVDIWVLNFYSIPTSAAISGTDLYQNVGGTDYNFDEYKGTIVYNKAETSTPFNRTMATKIQQFKNTLAATGYTEEFFTAGDK